MHYDEEIRHRNTILSRARNGERVTAEDRLWLATHRIFNRTLGYPYLNTDIIHLRPEVNYCIRIKVESLTYPGRVLPVITVPGGKGKIIANTLLTDHKGGVASRKSVKMLGILVDLNHNETEIIYCSNLGLLGVSFECEYFDNKQHIMLRKDSCVGDPNFAMLSEVLADNKIRYRCKTPENDGFESFVFSIEWNENTM